MSYRVKFAKRAAKQFKALPPLGDGRELKQVS